MAVIEFRNIVPPSFTLKEGDLIVFTLNGKEYDYEVVRGREIWFLYSADYENSIIFDELGLDKKVLQESVLGYFKGGGFPECRSAQDLRKFVNAIGERVIKMNEEESVGALPTLCAISGDDFYPLYNPSHSKVFNKPKSKLMAISNIAKRLLDSDTKTLIKAGFLDKSLDLTSKGYDAIWVILFETHKEALVKEAKAVIKEEESK